MKPAEMGVTAVIGVGATVVTILVGLNTLGVPGVVLTTDLDAIHRKIDGLEEFSKGTRMLVLNNDWWRLNTQLEDVKAQRADKPTDRYLRDLERNLSQQQKRIEQQIEQLEESGQS